MQATLSMRSGLGQSPMGVAGGQGSRLGRRTAVHDRFFEISRLLLSSTEFEQVLKNVAAGVCELVGYDRCLIATLGSGGRGMVGRAGFGLDAAEIARINGCVQDAPSFHELLGQGTPIVLQPDQLLLAVPQTYLNLFQVTGTLVVVPLVHAETGPVGALFVDRKGLVFEPGGAELQTLRDFADLATLAVRSAQNARDGHRLAALIDRSQIVADLHDGVAQLLFAADLALQEALAAPELPPAVADVVRGAGASVSKANDQLRTALWAMSQDEFQQGVQEGIGEQLRSLVAAFSEHSGIGADVELWGQGPSPSTEGERLLVRTVREGLANVLKHANATQVVVVLRRSDDWWVVEVHDDGAEDGSALRRHAPVEAQGGGTAFGLTSLRREASRLNGYMWLSASPRLDGVQLTMSLQVQP